MTLQLSQEFLRVNFSSAMESLHHRNTTGASLVFHLNFTKEFESNRLKRILRPLWEPINCCAVHKWREISDPVTEWISYRWETQANMQIYLTALNKI